MRGKVMHQNVVRKIREDHPRLCGEKIKEGYENRAKVRITPAYAGKRFPMLFS